MALRVDRDDLSARCWQADEQVAEITRGRDNLLARAGALTRDTTERNVPGVCRIWRFHVQGAAGLGRHPML